VFNLAILESGVHNFPRRGRDYLCPSRANFCPPGSPMQFPDKVWREDGTGRSDVDGCSGSGNVYRDLRDLERVEKLVLG
jgi:hypothetical protein